MRYINVLETWAHILTIGIYKPINKELKSRSNCVYKARATYFSLRRFIWKVVGYGGPGWGSLVTGGGCDRTTSVITRTAEVICIVGGAGGRRWDANLA